MRLYLEIANFIFFKKKYTFINSSSASKHWTLECKLTQIQSTESSTIQNWSWMWKWLKLSIKTPQLSIVKTHSWNWVFFRKSCASVGPQINTEPQTFFPSQRSSMKSTYSNALNARVGTSHGRCPQKCAQSQRNEIGPEPVGNRIDLTGPGAFNQPNGTPES